MQAGGSSVGKEVRFCETNPNPAGSSTFVKNEIRQIKAKLSNEINDQSFWQSQFESQFRRQSQIFATPSQRAQSDITTGTVMWRRTSRVAPPRMSSRMREWP